MSSYVYSYNWWWAKLLNVEPPRVPADRICPGFYFHYRRDGQMIGVAVWADAGVAVAKYGHEPARCFTSRADEEDWSFGTFAFLKPVAEDAYRTWAATGEWPEEIVAAARAPRRGRKKSPTPDTCEAQ